MLHRQSTDDNRSESLRRQQPWCDLSITRRGLILGSLLSVVGIMSGCARPAVRAQSPEAFEEALKDVRLVRDMTLPFGVHPLRIDSVAMVMNLSGGGSDPPLSPGRSVMIEEIQRHGVPHAERLLASPDTSLVNVRGYLNPGIQKGDRFDIEVFVPARSKTIDLSGGVLLESEMREYIQGGGSVHKGHVTALAKGPLMVDPLADSKEKPETLLRARILGGGVAMKTRPLGLAIANDVQSLRNNQQIETAINERFYLKRNGRSEGVAKAKTDDYIALTLHPRYKGNLLRYFDVVRSVAVQESDSQRLMRLRLLERQLLDSVTSSSAAIRLEAIGDEAKDVLKKGLESPDQEVRFYAAEALAYLDDPAAAIPLADAAREESAFRASAFQALGAMRDLAVDDALAGLLDVASAETRYGAFRALKEMNPRHPLVRGEDIGQQFSLHSLRIDGPGMIHVTRSDRPEIVLFGRDIKLTTPLVLDAGANIMVNSTRDGRIRVSRFVAGENDRQVVVSSRVEDVVRAIVEVGGNYPDVVAALAQAKKSQSLDCRFMVDAIPQHGRSYRRSEQVANSASIE